MQELTSRISKRTKAILINTPNNPSGGLISKAEMETLALVAKNCGAYLICDEIYRKFIFNGAVFNSANSQRNTYEKIVIIDGFSKTYSMTGWRLGYIVASNEFISMAVKVVQHEITNVPEMLQIAACEVFSLPKDWFNQYLAIIEKNASYYTEATKDIQIIQTPPLRAGMFCFPKIDMKIAGSDQLAVELLKTKCCCDTRHCIWNELG